MKTAAIIGCGKATNQKEGWAIGHAHAHAYRQAFSDIELYGVDINPENLAAFGQQFGLDDTHLFSSTQQLYAANVPDAVSVCTWPVMHLPLVDEAARAGVRAITCEKPMALDGSEIDEMIQVCQSLGSSLAIAHQRRYDNHFILARKLLTQGLIGSKLVLHARVGDGWDILSWTVHWFDMAGFLLNDKPISVLAGIDHTGQRRYQQAVEDSSVVFVEYDRGNQALFVTGPTDLSLGSNIQIIGDKGMMQIGDQEIIIMQEQGSQQFAVQRSEIEGFAGLFDDLWQGVHDPQHTIACGVEQTAMATRLAYAAHESARTCRKIMLQTHNVGYAPLEIMQHTARSNRMLGRVTLLADAHHADPVTRKSGRDGIRDALYALGAEQVHMVDVETREPTVDDLKDTDLLVLYHTQRQSSPQVRQLLSVWVAAGKPMVVTHCGIGAYSDWPQFRHWIGRYWVWHDEDLPPSGHPHVPCELQVVAGSDFEVPFDTAWLPRDEVYVQLGECVPIRELVTASIPDHTAFIAWQTIATPNVAVWVPGHRLEIWDLPVMRDGLLATIKACQKS